MGLDIRSTHEVYLAILRAIHLIQRSGDSITLSAIGHRALVPNNRLKRRLAELTALRLLDENMAITRAGYAYFEDYRKYLEPFLQKYRVKQRR